MYNIKKDKYTFEDLKEIMRILRSENGCPWDREQTHKSIRNNFIEEVYEAVEAIDGDNPELLKEELGDTLLQVVFHAQISEEAGEFDIDGVCDEICRKLIIRHPHIFGDTIADTSEQVLANWENIKIKEKGYAGTKEYIESTAKSLPALMRAEKIRKRLIKRKVIEPDSDDMLKKSEQDFSALKENFINKTLDFETVGKVLYDIVCLANEQNINSEQSLYIFSKKIIKNMLNN
ncbi:MAG: MazG family protein [Oscillospiraceae bacterium]|nr:MazG family protein [Oscillospiraceae bacterium]